ncbi:type II toxin-antitoxin system RelB/DinJ family antitoxin [Pediococcus pentosaceus]|uniref:type II toxin-antitoxin system RelB/DinJ family antitoxin n=1 Tax=Pediococcus pentosaceus TaxID=1255 RepID=UPI003594405B
MKKYKTVSARVPSEISEQSKRILDSKGVSVSIVIRSLLIQIAETGDVPFKI